MIIDAPKNKLFPFYSGNYYEEIKEESSESEGEDNITDISTLEQIIGIDRFYGSNLINKYFLENSLTKIINKLKDHEKILKKFRSITV